MYEYMKGKLSHATPTQVTLDLGGIGYALSIPLSNYSKLPRLGEEVLFYLSLVIREDAHTLYGFLTRTERDLFLKLTSISGVGPKTALALIGHMEASDLQLAISQSNINLLCKIPGIGKKTAERLVVEMRDTLKKAPLVDLKEADGPVSDALSALIHLGYNPLQAQKALKAAVANSKEELDLPKLITAALRSL
jgi:holliday junction DNA helicase RuvA